MGSYTNGTKDGSGGGGDGPVTPGATIDKGVVVWSGTDGATLADSGIRDYGSSSTDPTSPTPTDGDKYWNTSTNQKMVYDGGLSMWRPQDESIPTPTIVAPSASATGVSPKPTITGSGYFSDFGLTMERIEVQISTASDFSSYAVNSQQVGTSVNFIPDVLLAQNTLHYVRLRYKDTAGNWSNYSPASSFTTGVFPTEFVVATSSASPGDWNDAATWGLSGTTEGLHYPGSWGGADVYCNKYKGFKIPPGYAAKCKTLRVGNAIGYDGMDPVSLTTTEMTIGSNASLTITEDKGGYFGRSFTYLFDLKTSVSSGTTIELIQRSASAKPPDGAVLMFGNMDFNNLEYVKVSGTPTGTGTSGDPWVCTLLNDGSSNGIGGTWSGITKSHTAGETLERSNSTTPSFYGFSMVTTAYDSGALNLTMEEGSTLQMSGKRLRPSQGTHWYANGTRTNPVNILGAESKPTTYGTLGHDQIEYIDVAGYPSGCLHWAGVNFKNFDTVDMNIYGKNYFYSVDHDNVGPVFLGYNAASSSVRSYNINSRVNTKSPAGGSHSPASNYRFYGRSTASLTNANIWGQSSAFNTVWGAVLSTEMTIDEARSPSQGSSWYVQEDCLSLNSDDESYCIVQKNTMRLDSGAVEAAYGDANYTPVWSDNIWYATGGNTWWLTNFNNGSDAGSKEVLRNYLETSNLSDEGDIRINNLANQSWVLGDMVMRHAATTNAVLSTTFKNTMFRNITKIMTKNATDGGGGVVGAQYYNFLHMGTYYNTSVDGTTTVQKDSIFAKLNHATAANNGPESTIAAYDVGDGVDVFKTFRNNHYWQFRGGQSAGLTGHRFLSTEKPFREMTSAIDSSELSSHTTTSFTVDVNTAGWSAAGVEYPLLAVIDRGNAGEEVVEVSSYNSGVATCSTISGTHSDGTTVDMAYGYQDSEGDPLFVLEEGGLRDFHIALKQSEGAYTPGTVAEVETEIFLICKQWNDFFWGGDAYDERYRTPHIKEWLFQAATPLKTSIRTGGVGGTHQGAIPLNSTHWSNTSSIEMDGMDDHIVITDHADLRPTSVSLSCYLKVASSDSSESGNIYRKQGSYGIIVEAGKPGMTFTTSSASIDKSHPTLTIADGKWHKVAVTYDGSAGKGTLRLNGREILDETISVAGLEPSSGTNLIISQPTPTGIPGKFTQFALFNKALSNAEWNSIDWPRESSHVGFYRFEDGVTDSSGNGNNGTATAITYASGSVLNKAATFGGSSKIVLTNTSGLDFLQGKTHADGKFSICFYCKPSKVDAEQMLVEYGGTSVAIRIMINGKLRGSVYDDTGTPVEWYVESNSPLSVKGVSDPAYSIAFVNTGYDLRLYLDGVLQDFRYQNRGWIGTTINTGSGNFTIGATSAGGNGFEGSMERFEIHNKDLSQREIQYRHLKKTKPIDLEENAENTVFATNCKNYILFNDNPKLQEGGTARDASGENHPGTLTTFTAGTYPQSTDCPYWFDKE